MKKVGLACIFGFAIIVSALVGTSRSEVIAESKTVLVVATFDAKGVGADDVEFVMDVFTSNFATLGFAKIVDRTQFDKIKKELSFQDSDWSDSNKVAELGRALNANQVATGQLTKRGNNIFLTVKILDVNTTEIVTSYTDKVKSIDELFEKMPDFCDTLVSKAGGVSLFGAGSSGSSVRSSNLQDSIPYGKYKVGDIGTGGGVVFYTSEDGFYVYDGKGGKVLCHYLEMSKDTLGESRWFPECEGWIGTQTGLGHGKANTYKILNMSTEERLTDENCAVFRCSKYSTDSTKAGEWWLPSKDELDLIYKNQKNAVLATSTNSCYWSSSEIDDDDAWYQDFDDGYCSDNDKDFRPTSVRAVRAF